MIKKKLHKRQGSSSTNFSKTLPEIQSDLAKQTLKDPYVFDFLTIT
jgi:predicted nuclease of restriction endonuclease-like (RecB) superfamily